MSCRHQDKSGLQPRRESHSAAEISVYLRLETTGERFKKKKFFFLQRDQLYLDANGRARQRVHCSPVTEAGLCVRIIMLQES